MAKRGRKPTPEQKLRDSAMKALYNTDPKRFGFSLLGRMFGVSRQRVHQIVTGYDSHKGGGVESRHG